ncbi:MAG: hypothetical protein MRJ96_07130 [Nitrospirales bacterium]|nr:hypothetical protein [Nitrospira sp.]MDR4501204.1 hypothetical protein [Nitrospirales bacterium]
MQNSWLQRKWDAVRQVFRALTLIRFNIILGAACIFALHTDQGQDVLRALVEVDPWYRNALPKLSFLLFTLSFALTAWYFARVMFAFTFPSESGETPTHNAESFEGIKLLVTQWLGPIIIVMVMLALTKAAGSYESWTEAPSIQLIAMAVLLPILGIFVVLVIYPCLQHFHLYDRLEDKTQVISSLSDLPRGPRVWFLIAMIASVSSFFLFYIDHGSIGPWIGTAGILMLWATTLVAMGGGLVYLGNRYRVPVIGFIILWVIGWSLFNDNHRVRQTMTMRPYQEQQKSWTEMPKALLAAVFSYTKGIIPRGAKEEDPFEKYFLPWFKNLEQQWRAGRHNLPGHDGPIPVILVSTEGGGIRAAYWTANVLAELQDRSQELIRQGQIPLDFARHVFSISGVSGGSLGGAVFAGLIKEQHEEPQSTAPSTCGVRPGNPIRPSAQTILSQDFLSPTVGVLLFPDMFQRFLPVGILDDRALALEKAWERAWFDCTGSTRFAEPFDNLWDQEHFSVPLLFLNSTVVETGQRIIMHPLPFATLQSTQPNAPKTLQDISTFQDYFNNALDGPAVIGGKVPLSTAVHMSARFTYVSPAGTIFRQDLPPNDPTSQPEVIRVVDGGYFENSGAVTTDEILLAIRRVASEKNLSVHPIVIHISNDPLKHKTRTRREFTGSRAVLPEILSPVWALLNVRPARGYQAREELGQRAELGLSMQNTGSHTIGSFAHFQLCEFKRPLPLGWMLSELSRNDMNEQLPSIATSPDPLFKTIAQFNLNHLDVVLDGLAGNYHPSGNQTDILTDYERDCMGTPPTI